MLKPVYSGEQETATIDGPCTFTSEPHPVMSTFNSEPHPVMILTDKLVYIEQEKLDLAHTHSPAGRHLSFIVSDFEA